MRSPCETKNTFPYRLKLIRPTRPIRFLKSTADMILRDILLSVMNRLSAGRLGSVFDLVRNWHKHEICHELDYITRCPVFSGFLVILFIEFSDQLLKDSTHAVIIKAGMFENGLSRIFINRIRAQIDIGRSKFLNHRTKDICVHHRIDLVTEFELIQNHLNVRRAPSRYAMKSTFKV